MISSIELFCKVFLLFIKNCWTGFVTGLLIYMFCLIYYRDSLDNLCNITSVLAYINYPIMGIAVGAMFIFGLRGGLLAFLERTPAAISDAAQALTNRMSDKISQMGQPILPNKDE